MPNLKLTYFDFNGRRGEPARLAMFIGGIAFDEDRLSFDAFNESKASFPFGAIPVLEVDGQTVAQSNGINRFVGKLAGLYPEDPWQAALCDEAMDAVERPFRKGLSGRCRRGFRKVVETDLEPPCGRRPPESSIAARRCVIRLI